MTTSRQTTVAARDLARRIGRRAAVQIVLLCAVTAAVIGVTSMSSSSASASEVSGSWEGGGFAPFSALECPHPSSQFQLVTSPTREGSHAARFNITGADVWPNTGTVRCLAAKYDTGETTGMDSYFHVSMYIPSPGISSNLIWELHHPSELYNLSKCGVAPFAITTDGKRLEFRIATGDCKVGQGWSQLGVGHQDSRPEPVSEGYVDRRRRAHPLLGGVRRARRGLEPQRPAIRGRRARR